MWLPGDGRRLDRHGAGWIIRKVARGAGIAKAVTPHTLRYAFITASLDAGCWTGCWDSGGWGRPGYAGWELLWRAG